MVENGYNSAEEEDSSYLWIDDDSASTKKKKNNKGCGGGGDDNRKRRFSDEQVRSLELMFEAQTKLDPRKKLQLARELGLHPRQVSIWFQNKRARWKSKQLEREYGALRAEYEALVSDFEAVKNEKQLLTKQLKELAQRLEKPADAGDCNRWEDMLTSHDTNTRSAVSSDDEENKKSASCEEEAQLFHMQPEQQFCFHQPSWPSDQTAGATSQWWEFWPLNE